MMKNFKEFFGQLQESTPVASAPYVHRVGVTVSDPYDSAVSKRGKTIQRFVRVTHHTNDKDEAVARGKKYFAKKGWKVHDAWHAGMVHEEVELDEEQLDEAKVGPEHTFQPGDVVNVHWKDITGKTSHGTANVDKATSAYVHVKHPSHGGIVKFHQGINGKGGNEVGTQPGTRAGGYVISKKTTSEEVELDEALKTYHVQVGHPNGARTVKVQAKSKTHAVEVADKEHKKFGERVNKNSVELVKEEAELDEAFDPHKKAHPHGGTVMTAVDSFNKNEEGKPRLTVVFKPNRAPGKIHKGRTKSYDISHHYDEKEAEQAKQAYAKKFGYHALSKLGEETNESQEGIQMTNVKLNKEDFEQLVVTTVDAALYAIQEGRTVLDEQLDEAVSSSSKDNYEWTHGKKPKGYGNWFFSTVHPKQHDVEKHKDQTVNVTGTFGDAAKKAQSHFKEKGHKGEIHVLT